MKTVDNKPFIYEKNQLIETICQLRFPTILSINTKEPAEFQDAIRQTFPRYAVQTENPAPGDGGEPVKNHAFISADGCYKLNLTRDFISLSTMRYTGWETFAHALDEPLSAFISICRPGFFERIGLRYLNGISRERLGLGEYRWNDLFQPQYLGVLDDDSIREEDVVKSAMDMERKLDERCSVKIHAGPGSIRRAVRTDKGVQTVQEQETRFILDMDLFAAGNIRLNDAADIMETLHDHADRLFSDAITDTLHNAMEPVEL